MDSLKERVIKRMHEDLKHYQYLYCHTNHSKKKAQHKKMIKFMEDVIAETMEEYGFSYYKKN